MARGGGRQARTSVRRIESDESQDLNPTMTNRLSRTSVRHGRDGGKSGAPTAPKRQRMISDSTQEDLSLIHI